MAKIDPATLPSHPNIHYLGGKSYQELPAYLGGWDIAMLPFAINESTKFISPTKTPEYLAAGKPVISTPIRDVVRRYGENGLVRIASNSEEFVACAQEILSESSDVRTKWLSEVDAFLADNSWDNTWGEMLGLIESAIDDKRQKAERPDESFKLGMLRLKLKSYTLRIQNLTLNTPRCMSNYQLFLTLTLTHNQRCFNV